MQRAFNSWDAGSTPAAVTKEKEGQMSRFFTSDWHLGSSLINKYAKRPFGRQIDACIGLIDSCNYTAKRGDAVFHVGDFWLEGCDRHGEAEDKNELPAGADDYVKQISARFVLLAGNHDDGHNCEADLKNMRIDLNQNYRNVYVNHFPSDHHDYKGPGRIPKGMPFINLCGHVHDKWLLKYDRENHVLNINVGVDVWDYKLVRDSEITELLDYFRATMWTKINPAPGIWNNFVLTRDALEKFKTAHSIEVKERREARKQEKLKKKGLTPEICEQRRIEAMKAKGLL